MGRSGRPGADGRRCCTTRLKALKNEQAEVKLLLEAAARCDRPGPDAKAEALLDWLYRLQAEESDPEIKVLVFTEFVPTQEMLRRFSDRAWLLGGVPERLHGHGRAPAGPGGLRREVPHPHLHGCRWGRA